MFKIRAAVGHKNCGFTRATTQKWKLALFKEDGLCYEGLDLSQKERWQLMLL